TAGQLNDLNGCTVNPTLPANLTLARSDNTHTCVISGTPTEAQDAINYVITATNTSGSNTATVSIEIRNGSPDFADPDPVTIAVGDTLTQAYVNINPDGAAVTACAANSNLPQGLTIAAITGTGDDFRGGCTLSGSPIGVVAVADYDITVTNANGSFTLTLNITANPSDPMLTVPGSATRTYISGDAIDALTLINPVTAGHLNAIDGCTSDPNLTTATGLTLARSIDTHTCEISGTPTTVSDATDYVITATNANGSDTATVNITINPALPNLSAQTVRFVANEVGTHTLTNTGGGELLADDAPTPGCATTPELPNGLELNINTAASTCVISGTPTGVQAATSYDITATNRTGPGTAATVTIEILDGRPTFAADATTIVVGSQATQSYANTNPVGGPVTSCVATDALPTSLTIAAIVNTGNPEGFRGGCVLAGTPPTITAATDYNIMVTNTNGSTTLSLNIAIAPTAPMLETPAGQVYTSGAIIEPLELVNPASAGRLNTNGCTATDPLTNMPTELPTGLTLERSVDTNTCVISGTPADTQSATNYVITATNATGSDSVTVSIEILNGSPTFAAPASVTIAVDITPTQSYANTNTNAFSTAVTACVADALPAGLTIAPIADPGNVDNFRGGCALGGSPTTATAMNTYSITATNANGSSTLMLNITVDRGENMLGFNGVVNDALEWTFGGDDPATFVQAATASRDDGGTIVYASDNTLVATVGSAGEVTVLRPGVAVISATLAQTANYNAAAPASYTLTVRMAPPRISVSAFRTLSLSWPRIEAAAYYMVDHSPAAPDPGDERVFASVMVEGAEAPITNDNAAIVGDENRLSRNILIRAHQANWGGAQYQISACFDPSNTPADTSDDTCIDSQPADLAVSSSSEAVLFVKAPFPDTNILSGTESGLDVVSKALINELSDARVDVFGAAVGDRFGYATALSSDGLTLAIGTPGDDGSGTGVSTTIPTAISGSADSGAVYVYTRTSTTTAWAIQAYIKTPVASTSDQFGFALALGGDDTGNTLAIGAPLEDSAAIGTSGVVASASTTTSVAAPTTIDNDAANAGAVYVYARSSEGVWALQALLKASNAEAGDMFGAALAIDTNTLAVGAPLEDSSGSDATNNGAENAGAAYVYKRTSNAWTFEQYVKASNADADNRFGSALALATDTLA
ncbi:MAG: FG-GAP repeat protein, partial [Proteobacteria bacterium]|nr:FG-GAP repeat protein [Pseudomonadota bacterium]